MDHRVSKDMISQGMSVKGEKTTEELNNTQIGKIATPHNMLDAYQSIYSEDAQQVDEIVVSGTLAGLGALAAKAGGAVAAKTAAAGGAKAVAGGIAKNVAKNVAVDAAAGGAKKVAKSAGDLVAHNELEGEDLIQELRDSGLFSEEEINNILAKEDMNKGYVVTKADKTGNTPAWKGYKAGKTKKDGTPLYTPADHLKKDK